MASNGKKAKNNQRKTGATGVEKSKKNGQFLAGNNGGSGRPKGSINFMTSFTVWAETQKMTAGEAAEKLVAKLWDMAFNEGEMKAFQILADRVFGGIERGALLAMQINQQNTVHIGAETRNALKAMIDRSDIQDVMLDELERRTDHGKV